MAKTTKGSRGVDNGLMTRGDAVRHLGISPNMLKQLIRSGILEPVRSFGKEAFYVADVNAAAHVVQRKVNITTASRQALEALAISRRTQRKLEDMMVALGIEPVFEPLTVERVRDYWTTAQTRQQTENLTAEEVVAWARFFQQVDVGFLIMAADIYQTSEPWLPFMNLALALLFSAPKKTTNELNAAYAFLQSTVRWMRNGAYLYCRNMNGIAVANRIFPDEHDPNITNSIVAFVNYLEDIRTRSKLH